jgi:hypothetical protein
VYDILVMPVVVSFFILIGFMALIVMYTVYKPIFRKLHTDISDAKSLLSEIQLMIHAGNN